jgi:hypothetical protein
MDNLDREICFKKRDKKKLTINNKNKFKSHKIFSQGLSFHDFQLPKFYFNRQKKSLILIRNKLLNCVQLICKYLILASIEME